MEFKNIFDNIHQILSPDLSSLLNVEKHIKQGIEGVLSCTLFWCLIIAQSCMPININASAGTLPSLVFTGDKKINIMHIRDLILYFTAEQKKKTFYVKNYESGWRSTFTFN